MKQSSVHGQHREWATLGFLRAVASSRTICRCLMLDKRWLQTLLSIINDSTAAAAADDDDDDDDDGGEAHTDVHHCSLPKRVCTCRCLLIVLTILTLV